MGLELTRCHPLFSVYGWRRWRERQGTTYLSEDDSALIFQLLHGLELPPNSRIIIQIRVVQNENKFQSDLVHGSEGW
jgi:hypothetical protein